jgi:hypothetical protein
MRATCDEVSVRIIIIIQFFIYLRAELNSQWPITRSTQIQTTAAIRDETDKNKESGQLRLFIFKPEFLKDTCRFKNCICSRNTSS